MATRIGAADDLATVTAWLGNLTRLVPANDELLAELAARYRRAHGLPPTPRPRETHPLVLPGIGRETGRDKAPG